MDPIHRSSRQSAAGVLLDPHDTSDTIETNNRNSYADRIQALDQQIPYVYSLRSSRAEARDLASFPTAALPRITHTQPLPPSSYTSSPPLSPSTPPMSPPPPAIRIHDPHTAPLAQQDYITLDELAYRNSTNHHHHTMPHTGGDEKLSTDPIPFSPYHIGQLEDEKSAHRIRDHSSSPAHPASPPLYHTTFVHNPNFHRDHERNQSNPFASSSVPVAYPSLPPLASDLEMQNHDYYQQHSASSIIDNRSRPLNCGGAASSANILPISTPSSPSTKHHKPRSDGSGEIRRKRTVDHGSSGTRTSDAATVVVARERSEAASSSSSNNNHPPRTRSPGFTSKHQAHDAPSHVQQAKASALTTPTMAPPQAPSAPPASRKRFSLFRRTLPSFESPEKHSHIVGQGRNQEKPWKGIMRERQSSATISTTSSRRCLRNDSAMRMPYGIRGDRGPRKTGIPGRNGEEPETNVFNFVDIMLDMPEQPTWRQVVNKLLKVLAIMTISYFALMALYFAAEYNENSRLENINILVVDLDHSLIGTNFLNFTQLDNKVPGQFNWSIQSGYSDIQTVINDVDNGNYWGAMVVQTNASLMLFNALSTPLPNYDPTKAFMFIYDGGRDPLQVPYVVAGMVTQFLQFVKFFSPAWVNFVLQFADSNNQTLTPLVEAPQVLGTPVAFQTLNLHPPTASIIASATSVAYIWIFLVAGGSTYLVAHMVQPMTRYASVGRTMIMLLLPLLAFLCSLSMTYSVLLRIFGVPFQSVGQFLALFMSMLLLQAAVASLVLFLIFLIPVVFIPSITTTFVVMNVIAIFKPVEVMPSFYRWVYAMPFLNAVQLTRHVLMGSYNRISYNVPILFAWIMVPITLLPFAIARQKRLMMEILEMERRERHQYQQQQQRNHSDKGSSGYRPHIEDEYEYDQDDDAYDFGHRAGKSSTRWRRSGEFDRHRSVRSRYQNAGLSEDGGQDSQSAEEDTKQRRVRRLPDRSDQDENEEEDIDDDGSVEGSASNVANMIRPLNPRTINSGAAPSAPPESQVFDNDNRVAARRSLDHNRSYLEMPKLHRHPYASELARAQTPHEVK